MNNFYEILEVSEKASSEVIDRAYRVLAKKYHPDLQVENKKESEEKMKQINEAYETLMNNEKREEYDKQLEQERNKNKNVVGADTSAEQQRSTRNPEASVEPKRYTRNVTEDEEINPNLKNMTEKEAKIELKIQRRNRIKLEREKRRRYLEAYDDYLISRGYRIRYRWTFKKVIQLILTIIITILVLYLLWLIPPIKKTLTELYIQNNIVKFIVDVIIDLINLIYKLIINLF